MEEKFEAEMDEAAETIVVFRQYGQVELRTKSEIHERPVDEWSEKSCACGAKELENPDTPECCT